MVLRTSSSSMHVMGWTWLLLLVACAKDPPAPAASSNPVASASSSVASSLPSASATPVEAVAKPPPESVACQHVLVAYRGARAAPTGIVRSKGQAKARAEEVLKKATAGEDIAALAKEYSDDKESRDRLGSAGKFKREGMVKPFSDAAFALPVGGLSDVVETAFGFHVIKRNQ